MNPRHAALVIMVCGALAVLLAQTWHRECMTALRPLPFFLNGAAGDPTPESLALLKSWGGNCIRVFNPTNAQNFLDMAQAAGMKLMLGLSWTPNRDQQQELQRIVDIVNTYKTHPGLACWNIGNEKEGPIRSDLASCNAFVDQVNAVASAIKVADPVHPVIYTCIDFGSAPHPPMTTAFRRGTTLDAIGINTYNGAPSLARRYASWKLPVPFVVTELGWNPALLGKREAPWGNYAYYEISSTEKAEHYRLAVEGLLASPQCAGIIVFRWGVGGSLATDTWHMIYTPQLMRTDVAEELIRAWLGGYPTQRAPKIVSPMAFVYGPTRKRETGWKGIVANAEDGIYTPGQTARFHVQVSHPTPVQYRWELRAQTIISKGDAVTRGALLGSHITTVPALDLVVPSTPGMYRIYIYVEDLAARTAAYTSRPFLVK